MSIRPYLVLLRAGTLFSPGADIIAGACIVAGIHGDFTGSIWSASVGRMIVASILLYAAGMILNDHADRNIDAKQRPERPIPSGEIRAGTALILGLAGLGGALATSPVPMFHGIMAALVLGYNYVIKTNALAGALTMGSLRAMNLSVPFVAAQQNAEESITTTLREMAQPAIGYFLYIIAVTFLGILEDSRKVQRRAVLGLISIPPIACVLVILALPQRWPASAIAMVLAGVFLWRHRDVEWDQKSIRGAMMWLLLGTMLYTSLLALGNGRWIESLIIVAMLLTARVIARRIALT